MCRWAIFAARDPITINNLYINTENSLVQQSFAATWHPGFTSVNNAVLNADGLGLGWYHNEAPLLYKTVIPAWSDLNLSDITSCIKSSLIFGHVRAASPGSIVSRENCHPFRFGRLLFQHNGHIEQFPKIKRQMLSMMTEEAHLSIQGVTDSEHAFALLLSNLPEASRKRPFTLGELEGAMTATIEQLMCLLTKAGIDTGFTSLNFALADGETVIVTRFCDKWPKTQPPSLYFCYAKCLDLYPVLDEAQARGGPGDGSELSEKAEVQAPATALQDDLHSIWDERWRKDDAAIKEACKDSALRALLVSSEPMTNSSKIVWYAMPANSMMVYTRETECTDSPTRPVLKHLEIDPCSGHCTAKRRRLD